MERVLDVYKRPYDPLYPVVCMDESPKQLISETKVPIPVSPGHVAKHDYEYRRCGVCNIFLASEPLAGKRIVKVTQKKPKWTGLPLLMISPVNTRVQKKLPWLWII